MCNVFLRLLSYCLIWISPNIIRKLTNLVTIKADNNLQKKQLLVDVTNIIQHDHGTGIQRVVRALLTQLNSNLPKEFELKPIYATRKRAFRYAPMNFLDLSTDNKSYIDTENYVKVKRGDVFIGLDLNANRLPNYLAQIMMWKIRGVFVQIVVYDLLPLQNPQWFQKVTVNNFKRWIRVVAMVSNKVFCISTVVQNDLQKCFASSYGISPQHLETKVIPMGWDIAETKPSMGLPYDFENAFEKIKVNKSALMVGTLEPRKGHKEILEAFNKIWDSGINLNLVIVGRPGWKTEETQLKIKSHPLLNKKLFWFDDASDEALHMLYQAVDGVIVASYAEGFGLPLLEALGYFKPVLARDLPVFREYQNQNISYFNNTQGLDQQIKNWILGLKLPTQKHINEEISVPMWKDSVNELVTGF